jgi:hypothetical protein
VRGNYHGFHKSRFLNRPVEHQREHYEITAEAQEEK